MSDRSLARFTRPHEPNLTEVVLSGGEQLPPEAVRRIIDALQVAAAYLHQPNGSFIAVRPQPDLARSHLVMYLEALLDAEVPGRHETAPPAKPSVFGAATAADVPEWSAASVDDAADPTGVYSSPRERANPTKRFDSTGALY